MSLADYNSSNKPKQARMITNFQDQSLRMKYSLFLPSYSGVFNNCTFSFCNQIAKPQSKNYVHFPAYPLHPLQESESPSFETRYEPSIIIQSSIQGNLPQSSKKSKQERKSKQAPRKPLQKDSRNVGSNLLRIFLKHIIQLRYYDAIITKMIAATCFTGSCEDFHKWLLSFNINFKNYIRLTEIKKMMNAKENKEMRGILKMLIKRYIHGIGLAHCLTSRRIERASTNMHLNGLRELMSNSLNE